MGNEKSHPSGLVIEEKSFSTDNFWTLHSASYGTGLPKKVTVFVGVAENKNNKSSLEKFAKNLMIYRHPNILRYIASWKVHDQFNLVTEDVQTLLQTLGQLTPLQVCIGLHCILKALNFLHDKALSSHNNVCQAAIYVTPEGYWKLGGMEHLCRFSDLSARYLAETRPGRYERGIPPGEESRVPQPPSVIDRYAFCVLVIEVLGKCTEDEVPGLLDFVKMCREFVDSTDYHGRYSLSSFLMHKFFNHEFITIHNFLTELPLKSETERQLFFRELSGKLHGFSETIVGSQLGSLLLSRVVLLDSTAQESLLPYLLKPRRGEARDCIFSEKTFRRYIAPRLLSIFYVRDIQVRLTLLKHFNSFCYVFSTADLQSHILPELLVGVKDTNNELVEATLRALADLVPVLGAAAVIGGKRAKHFSDGRPKVHKRTRSIIKKTTKTLETEPEEGEIFLAERPSPDGGEAPSLEPPQTDDEAESWDAWDPLPQPQPPADETVEEIEVSLEGLHVEEGAGPLLSSALLPSDPTVLPTILPGTVSKSLSTSSITEDSLDAYEVKAKIIPRKSSDEELDFFRDMEPVIVKTSVLEIPPPPQISRGHPNDPSSLKTTSVKSKFDFSSEAEPQGWGEELDWADVVD